MRKPILCHMLTTKMQIRLPAHPCSLISASVVCLDIIITNVAANTVKLAASAVEQTYLSPPFLHTSEDKFSHGMAYGLFNFCPSFPTFPLCRSCT